MINSKKYALVFVRRRQILDDMVLDTNIPEDDFPEWDEHEQYQTGSEVIVLEDHGIYVSSADDNEGNNPLTTPEKWSRRESTNRWRVFDDSISSRATRPSLITYQVRPGRAAGVIAFMGLIGATNVRVQAIDPDYGEVYDKTNYVGSTTSAPSWWQWFFGLRTLGQSLTVFEDLPTYPNAVIHITITGSEALGVGMIMFGQKRSFGYGARRGARAGITTYSTVKREIDGSADIKRRPPAKRMSLVASLSNSEVDQLYRYLSDTESEPQLLIASRRFETFVGFGLIKNFEVIIPDSPLSECSIEFDGMT